MQVIGSGFGRTGTRSTKRALEILGFTKCHHMEEVIRSPRQLSHWAAVAAGQPVDWHEVFTGFESCVDFPASTQWRSISAAFPDAKILHTVRDPARWYASTYETIYPIRGVFPAWLRARRPVRTFLEMVNTLVWDGVLQGTMEDEARAIAVYEAWTADVVATVPGDRLLVFDVAQGWEPLCAFLGVPVPDVLFPRLNDRASMMRRLGAARVVSRIGPPALVASVGLLVRRAATSRRRSS